MTKKEPKILEKPFGLSSDGSAVFHQRQWPWPHTVNGADGVEVNDGDGKRTLAILVQRWQWHVRPRAASTLTRHKERGQGKLRF
ncbi:hypothetical protein V6Z11_D09G164400 [Gossypium hirsutum]